MKMSIFFLTVIEELEYNPMFYYNICIRLTLYYVMTYGYGKAC